MLLPDDPDMLDQYCMACTCMQSGQVVIQSLPLPLTRLIAKQKLDWWQLQKSLSLPTFTRHFQLLVYHSKTCALGDHDSDRRRLYGRRSSSTETFVHTRCNSNSGPSTHHDILQTAFKLTHYVIWNRSYPGLLRIAAGYGCVHRRTVHPETLQRWSFGQPTSKGSRVST